MPIATQSHAIVRKANEAKGSTAASERPVAATLRFDASPAFPDASQCSEFATPRKRFEMAAKIPASDSGRMSANQGSLGFSAKAIPSIIGNALIISANLAATLV